MRLREAFVERLGVAGKHRHDGTQVAAVGDELASFADDPPDLRGGAARTTPGDARSGRGGRDGILGCDHFRMSPVQRAVEAERKIAGADEEPIHPLGRCNRLDIGQRLRGLDLHDQQGVLMRGRGIQGRPLQIEVIVDPGAVESSLYDWRELHRLGQHGGIPGQIDQRNHQFRGAVFEQVKEVGGITAASADDAIDVGEMMQADEPLELPPSPGVVLGIEPDGVIPRFGRVRRHHRAGINTCRRCGQAGSA